MTPEQPQEHGHGPGVGASDGRLGADARQVFAPEDAQEDSLAVHGEQSTGRIARQFVRERRDPHRRVVERLRDRWVVDTLAGDLHLDLVGSLLEDRDDVRVDEFGVTRVEHSSPVISGYGPDNFRVRAG